MQSEDLLNMLDLRAIYDFVFGSGGTTILWFQEPSRVIVIRYSKFWLAIRAVSSVNRGPLLRRMILIVNSNQLTAAMPFHCGNDNQLDSLLLARWLQLAFVSHIWIVGLRTYRYMQRAIYIPIINCLVRRLWCGPLFYCVRKCTHQEGIVRWSSVNSIICGPHWGFLPEGKHNQTSIRCISRLAAIITTHMGIPSKVCWLKVWESLKYIWHTVKRFNMMFQELTKIYVDG